MRKFIIIAILLGVGNLAFCHHKDHDQSKETRKRIEAQRISFITQELDLTPTEAQQFWPLYNEMQKKKESFRHRNRSLFRKMKDSNLSDKEIESISNEIIENKVTEANLEKEYYYKFKKILPIKKVLIHYQAERKFQKILLRQIREKGRHHGKR